MHKQQTKKSSKDERYNLDELYKVNDQGTLQEINRRVKQVEESEHFLERSFQQLHNAYFVGIVALLAFWGAALFSDANKENELIKYLLLLTLISLGSYFIYVGEVYSYAYRKHLKNVDDILKKSTSSTASATHFFSSSVRPVLYLSIAVVLLMTVYLLTGISLLLGFI